MSKTSAALAADPPVRPLPAALGSALGAVLAARVSPADPAADGIPTLWVEPADLAAVLGRLKAGAWPMLYDLTAIDERTRAQREARGDYTAVYQLLTLTPSHGEETFLRLKVTLDGDEPSLPSVQGLFPNADWYEREAWDLFGIRIDGHPRLRRILLPPTWEGHPLRKDHRARATEMAPCELPEERLRREQEALRFDPQAWGMTSGREGTDFLFLNLGPNHPSVHGVFRLVLQLDGEEIVDIVPDIGYHHRGAEKMAERQTWHGYIPYTDRVDYLGGVMNNLPYVLAVERLAGIQAPDRAVVARVMLCELFRIASHLVMFGTMAQDLGQMSPVFYAFADRQRVYDIIEPVTGARMHPAWFRIGGLAADLPDGWDALVRDYLDYQERRLDAYEPMVMGNGMVQRRTRGIGAYDTATALEWGVTGPNLRATGLGWDLRKVRPYAGYDRFEFEVPTAEGGDCYARIQVRLAEMRQSLRIIRQCLENMPAGDYKARHPLTTPPIKDYSLQDIETLIHRFVEIGWGPVIPAGEACVAVEGTQGLNSYYLVSDGGTMSYRTRIRTPSFPHLQMIPAFGRGHTVADLIAILGSIDFVMADVDR